jgi:hypothetical protein
MYYGWSGIPMYGFRLLAGVVLRSYRRFLQWIDGILLPGLVPEGG